jgi:deoxycytidylate deaminase
LNFIKNNKMDIIDKLIKVAKNSSIVSQKHGAALISNKKIYSICANAIIKIIHVNNTMHSRSIHAELNVFSKFSKNNVKNMDIIVIRVNKHNVLKNSRPCNDCIEKLTICGIRKVYYSNSNGEIVSEIVQDMKKIHVSLGNRKMLENKMKSTKV